MYCNLFRQFALIICMLHPALSLQSQTLTAEESTNGIGIFEEGRPVLFFNTTVNSKEGDYARSNYVHPLYGLDGEQLTEDFPQDHLHQRGIYWAWVQVYIGATRVGDLWHTKDIIAEVEDAFTMENEKGEMQLFSIANWKSPNWNDGGHFVKDSAVITVYPRKANYYMVDFDIYLSGLTDSVMIGGTESEKEYSGFIARLAMPDDITFSSNDGQVKAQNAAVRAGNRMEFNGSFSDATKGIVIIAHPGNPEPNNLWVLRTKGSMQNAVYPGLRTVVVPTTDPMNLKYRMVVHDGSLGKEEIENIAAKFKE